MLRGFAIPSDGDISDIVNSRKLGKALSRNNKWLNVSSFFKGFTYTLLGYA